MPRAEAGLLGHPASLCLVDVRGQEGAGASPAGVQWAPASNPALPPWGLPGPAWLWTPEPISCPLPNGLIAFPLTFDML